MDPSFLLICGTSVGTILTYSEMVRDASFCSICSRFQERMKCDCSLTLALSFSTTAKHFDEMLSMTTLRSFWSSEFSIYSLIGPIIFLTRMLSHWSFWLDSLAIIYSRNAPSSPS
jgi:hypothetical protein